MKWCLVNFNWYNRLLQANQIFKVAFNVHVNFKETFRPSVHETGESKIQAHINETTKQ